MVQARFVNDTHTVIVRSIGSATSHEQLIHRDLPEQHPMSAITGLTEALAGQTSDLQAEVTRATEAEEQLSSDIQAETTRAEGVESGLNTAISNETSARQQGDTTLQNNITVEENRAKGIENGLRSDLTTETTARQNADTGLQGQITTNANDIDSIESKIPAQASANNQLADKDFVNSSIATNTATFRGTYNSVEDLEAYSGEKDNNDYAFVTGVDSLGNSYYDNYVYNGSAWVKRYRLNNSTFTASQWAAINSNATSENIAQIGTNTNAINAINNTLNGYGDVVTHNVNEFATSAQGAKADTALQPAALNGYATENYVDTGLTGKANVGLDNLNASGQMIVDSVDGTISNCILEIPQNIKVEINGSTLTHKSGSIFVLGGSTYTTYTLTQDRSIDLSTTADGRYVVQPGGNGAPVITLLSKSFSGSELPASASSGDRFFKTDDKTFWFYSTQWGTSSVMYPSCVVDVVNGVASFAKDSKGRDLIFNGCGFIGHHAFVLPNVKALVCKGYKEDGTLNSSLFDNQSLQIIELRNPSYYYPIQLGIGDRIARPAYRYIKTKDELSQRASLIQYVESDNLCYLWNGSSYGTQNWCPFVDYNYNGTTVTDFTIRQPVRLATTEMLDNLQDQVDLTTLTGYDSTQTQTLKNINGVLQWVTD